MAERVTHSGKLLGDLSKPSSVDPLLTGKERLEQRYGNYTYGSDPQYAQRQAEQLQGQGDTAQRRLGAYGEGAADTAGAIRDRQTPGTDFSAADATMGRQGDLYGSIKAYADQGPGPSGAQALLKQGTNEAMQNQLAMAASGRGMGGSASALRQAQGANAATAMNASNSAAQLAAQESAAHRQQQLAAYGLGGDVLQAQAGQQSQNAQFLTQAELQAAQQRDSASLGYQQLGLEGIQAGYGTQLAYEGEARANLDAEAQANQAYETNVSNLAIGELDARNSREQRAADEEARTTGALIGAGTSLAGAALMFSDEDAKTGIEPVSGTAAAYGENDTLKKIAADREERKKEREEAERAQKANNIMSILSSVKDGYMSSDARSKEKIRELKTENKALSSALSAYGEPKVDFAFGTNEEEDAGRRVDFDFGANEPARAGSFVRPNVKAPPVADLDRAYERSQYDIAIGDPYDLRPAKPYTYEYKDPKAPGAKPGKQTGPMAQDLEHLPGVVQQTPQGKMVDTQRLTAVNASALGEQQKRLDRLEARLEAYGY